MGLSGSSGWGLAVDYGTSFTAAAVFDGAGVEVLEVEDSPRFPSAVLLADDGSLLTGRAALNQARRHPDRYERTPKRLVGQPAALLGGRAVEVVAMVGAVLTRVVGAARVRQGSSSPAWVRLTHPAGWGPERCEVLRTAAARAGLERVELLSEPEAAAWFFVEDRRGEEPVVGEGGCVAIYDLGGGTFDTAILRREASGFRLAGPPGGLDWFGGEDFDQRLYDWVLGRVYELNSAVWRELSEPRSPGWRRARLQLREDVRQAKEALSTTNTVSVPVAAGGDEVLDVTVTRLDFERLIRDDLEGTVGVLEKTARDAGVSREEIAAVYLTGGSSRVPLAGALASRFHPRTYTRPDPKTLVVRGAIAGHLAAQARPVAVEPPVAGPEPVVAPAGPVREPGVSMPEPAAAPPAETRAPEPQAAAPAGAPPGLPAWLVRDGRPRLVALGLVALAALVLAGVAFAALGGGSEAPALEITASEYVAGRANLARVAGTVDPAGARVRVQGRSVQVRDGRWRTTARVGSGERVRVVASGPEGSVTETVPVTPRGSPAPGSSPRAMNSRATCSADGWSEPGRNGDSGRYARTGAVGPRARLPLAWRRDANPPPAPRRVLLRQPRLHPAAQRHLPRAPLRQPLDNEDRADRNGIRGRGPPARDPLPRRGAAPQPAAGIRPLSGWSARHPVKRPPRLGSFSACRAPRPGLVSLGTRLVRLQARGVGKIPPRSAVVGWTYSISRSGGTVSEYPYDELSAEVPPDEPVATDPYVEEPVVAEPPPPPPVEPPPPPPVEEPPPPPVEEPPPPPVEQAPPPPPVEESPPPPPAEGPPPPPVEDPSAGQSVEQVAPDESPVRPGQPGFEEEPRTSRRRG